MDEKQPSEAWKILLDIVDKKDKEITDLKKREIELLQKLMLTEENVKGLIHTIASKLYKEKPIVEEAQQNTQTKESASNEEA